MNNPFEVLGLKGLATPDEIRTAYRTLARQCHPDMIQDPAEKEAAQRAMARNNPEGALRSLIRCEKRDGDWYYMQGKVLMAMEEYESAHQSFREAVRLAPENNVYRAGALAAAVAQQKASRFPMKMKKAIKHLIRK